MRQYKGRREEKLPHSHRFRTEGLKGKYSVARKLGSAKGTSTSTLMQLLGDTANHQGIRSKGS
jgi:hypothetical protein